MVQLLQSASTQDALDSAAPSEFTFTFWKGRVALYGALKALGIGPGDSVIVPGYTCAMVPGAVLFAGATCIYADIDPKIYSPSLRDYSAVFEASSGKRIKALVLQHTYGIPGESSGIAAWARARGMAVIEDCAHSLGTRYRDESGSWREAGTAGDLSIFSSQWSKPVSTGLGGWLVTTNKCLAKKVARFHEEECSEPPLREISLLAGQLALRSMFFSPRFYWIAATLFRSLAARGIFVGTNESGEFEGKMPEGYARRMSGLQQWLLSKRLAATELVERRRKLKQVYDDALSSCGFPALAVPDHADPVLLRYPLRVRNKPEVLEKARRNRIELGDWFNHPLHPREANAEAFGYFPGLCPEAERAARDVINLPLTERTREKTARAAVKFLSQVASI